MNIREHKIEIRENMKSFLRQMSEEHKLSMDEAKAILVSEAMDSAAEIGLGTEGESSLEWWSMTTPST